MLMLKYFFNFFKIMRTKIYDISGTVAVRIPHDFVKQYDVRKTGYLDVREGDEGSLIIRVEKVR